MDNKASDKGSLTRSCTDKWGLTNRTNWGDTSNDYSAETKNLENIVKGGTAVCDEVAGRPFFSFNINIDLSDFGEGVHAYNVKWQNGGLKIVPSQRGTESTTTSVVDAASRSGGVEQALPKRDGSSEPWSKVSVRIDRVFKVANIQEFQTVKNKKQERKIKRLKSRNSKSTIKSWFGFPKPKEGLEYSNQSDVYDDYLIADDEKERWGTTFCRKMECSFSVENKCPDTRLPLLCMTLTPTRDPKSNERDEKNVKMPPSNSSSGTPLLPRLKSRSTRI